MRGTRRLFPDLHARKRLRRSVYRAGGSQPRRPLHHVQPRRFLAAARLAPRENPPPRSTLSRDRPCASRHRQGPPHHRPLVHAVRRSSPLCTTYRSRMAPMWKQGVGFVVIAQTCSVPPSRKTLIGRPAAKPNSWYRSAEGTSTAAHILANQAATGSSPKNIRHDQTPDRQEGRARHVLETARPSRNSLSWSVPIA